jgi:hypothetical protein
VVSLKWGVDPFLLLFLGLFAFQNVQRARLASRSDPAAPQSASGDALEAAEIESATAEVRSLLQSRQHDAALAVAARLDGRGGPLSSAAALRLRAGIALSRGDNEAAALFAGQSFSVWPTPDAAVVAARANLRLGQPDRARNWLRRAVEAGATLGAVRSDPELGALA